VTDTRARDAHAKAGVLAEALPYIREFSGKTVVIKYGGHAMEDPALAELFAQDVVLMRLVGMNPVVVHGGGPQISELMRRLGKEPEFVDGLRVTDAETVDIVQMALIGKINPEIVTALNQHGSYAVGLSGADACLITVDQRDVRLGFVGDVRHVNPAILERVLREDLIPVVATVGVDEGGQAYNVNADAVAGAMAAALKAKRMLLLTDVPGVLDKNGERIEQLTIAEARRMIETGAATGGMIPKLETAIHAVEQGVEAVVILDGRRPHAMLMELYTEHGSGTLVKR
jgi:acetylglutamate kinase